MPVRPLWNQCLHTRPEAGFYGAKGWVNLHNYVLEIGY